MTTKQERLQTKKAYAFALLHLFVIPVILGLLSYFKLNTHLTLTVPGAYIVMLTFLHIVRVVKNDYSSYEELRTAKFFVVLRFILLTIILASTFVAFAL